MAFVDQTNLIIKFSYMTGSGQMVVEPVAGDGAAAFVRLGFLSTGIPIVAWTSGAYVKVAVRSAATSTATATWSAGVVETTVAPRALEMAVSPLDQVLLSYVSDTATAGRPKIAICDAPCSAPSGFLPMNTTPQVENTAVIAATMGTGAAWCQASPTLYYPAVTYSVTGNVKYATCQNSMTNCLNGANWTNGAVAAITSTSSKLLIDTNFAADVPKVMAYNGTTNTPYIMGSTGCTLAPSTFTAGTALGNYGNLWMSIFKDTTNGRYHFVGNSATTSVVYLNSPTTSFTAAWNAVGTAETTTLAATSVGGAAIDTASRGIYTSYGINAANFDIRLTKVNDYTLPSNSATIVYSKQVVDTTGMMQFSPTAGTQTKNVAAATSSSGRLGVAYVDFSPGSVTTGRLKFAYRNGTNSAASWSSVLVPDTTSPQMPSVAFDQNNKPWIGYFEAAINRFYLVTNSQSDGTGNWTSYEFPATVSGAPGALPMANNTAVAMRYSSGVSHPVMVIIDTNATSRGVKSAQLNATTKSWEQVTTVDALGASGAAHLSTSFDTNGNVVMAFQDLTTTRVKYSYMQNASTWAGTYTVSAAARGPGAAVSINPVTYSPAISYFDSVNNTVYYSACSGTISSCIAGGWTTSALDTAAGVSTLTSATGQLLTTGLVFNSAGSAHVFSPRGATSSSGALTMSHNRTGSFATSAAIAGVNGAMTGSAALNFGITGWGLAATPNVSGGVSGAYVGPGNWLYAFSCGD